MDRALLERMIGAIALVLLLVIVAPALLDGTRESGSDRISGAQDNQDVRTEIIVLNEPRDPEVLQVPEPAATGALQPGIIMGSRSAPAAKAAEAPSPEASAVTPAETSANNSRRDPSPGSNANPSCCSHSNSHSNSNSHCN